jgi:ABC-type Mn2+/Zn2+ transport system permease subunit
LFFERAGSVIAWIAVVFGAVRVLMGFAIAFMFDLEQNAAASRRYLATANSGEAIEDGSAMFLTGIIIGLLVQIAKQTRTRNDD